MKKQLGLSREFLGAVPAASACATRAGQSLRAASSFGWLLLLCFAGSVLAHGQIVCGSACKSGSIPVFTSSGTNASISDSLFTQSGSTLSLNGSQTISGNLSLASSGTKAGNILKGSTLFLHDFGTNNVFLGLNAGNLTLGYSANNNTAIGANALPSLTTGCCNTAAGNNALLQNTSGGGNTATGDGALYTNSSGSNNTAIGRWALISNSTGNVNTALGVQTLQNNSTGIANTATGVYALQNNTTGSRNTAIGNNVLIFNTNGSDNTGVGQGALVNDCSSPCALGQGGGNAATGTNALYYNTTGNVNTATGYYSLMNNTTGNDNTAVGHIALYSNSTGTDNTAIGHFADVSSGNLTNATALGAYAVVNASNKIRLGNNSVTVIEGQVPYTYTSDRNQKENFQPVDGEQVLRKILGLNLTSWNYVGHDPKQFRHYGPVAQEFYAAFGHDGLGSVGNDTTINSGDLDGILMIAVQTLEKHMEELETLRNTNADLKARLEKLERSNGW
jgi:trimeric autotransporter adhesin